MASVDESQIVSEKYKTLRHFIYALSGYFCIREIAGKITIFDLAAKVDVVDCSKLETLLYICLGLILLLLVAIYCLSRYYETQRSINKQLIKDKQHQLENLERQLTKRRQSSRLSKDGETKAGD